MSARRTVVVRMTPREACVAYIALDVMIALLDAGTVQRVALGVEADELRQARAQFERGLAAVSEDRATRPVVRSRPDPR